LRTSISVAAASSAMLRYDILAMLALLHLVRCPDVAAGRRSTDGLPGLYCSVLATACSLCLALAPFVVPLDVGSLLLLFTPLVAPCREPALRWSSSRSPLPFTSAELSLFITEAHKLDSSASSHNSLRLPSFLPHAAAPPDRHSTVSSAAIYQPLRRIF